MIYDIYMDKFSKRLNELIKENSVSIPQMAIDLCFSDKSVIYRWIKGQDCPALKKALALADYFNCSLDYLFGLTDDNSKNDFKQPLPFNEQLKNVLKEKQASQNELIMFGNFSSNNMHNWLKLKANPQMDTLIRLANYLSVSLDYLVGRV